MIYGIAIGGNLGDTLALFQRACILLEQRSVSILTKSPVFSSKPVDCPPDSPDFLNTTIKVSTELEPLALLDITQSIEHELGRVITHQRNAPRPVDLDLLFAQTNSESTRENVTQGISFHNDRLSLPHPRMHLRRFVLEPLSYICPKLVIPRQTLAISEILSANTEPPLQMIHSIW